MKTYPLLQSQMGVFMEWLANPEMTQYNLPFIFPLSASIDSGRMVKAIERLVEARPEMKMRFVMEDGEVRQYIDRDIHISMNVKRMTEEQAQAYHASFIRPYDLLSGESLWRFELVETEVQKHFFMDCHHIMADGTSICHTFFSELASLYNGGQLTPHEKTILDYAEAEAASFGSESYLRAKAYQTAKFGEVSLLSLAQESGDVWGRQLRCSSYLPIEQTETWSRSIGTKGNRLIMAAFSYVMSVLSREDKVAYTTVRSGRTDEDMRQAYGMFVKTMPVLADVDRSRKVGDFIRGFRDELVSAIQNDAYPFTHFCQDMGQKPGVMFAFQGGDVEEVLHLDGVNYSFRVMQQELTAADLSALVFIKGDQYEIRVEASGKLHSEAYLQMVADAVRTTALQMMAHPDDELGSISIINEEEEARLIQLGDGGVQDYDRSETLVDIFRRQAAETPDRTAVVYKDRQLTYREADELTDRLAVKLHSMGACPEQAVGVMIDRSELMFIYPMAIMKAGAAYMPLDSHFPEDRLTFMCQDAGVRLILADDGLVQQALPGFDGTVFQRSELDALTAVSAGEVAALPNATPQNMFVILYTSGSTGKPKGCMLEHHNIVNFCHWYTDAFKVTAEDRVVAYANFGFDAHMLDLYPALSVGACVHILASDIRLDLMAMGRYIEDNRLTVAFMTTQIGYLFATSVENHSLRLLSVGGEKLQPIRKPPYSFYNVYGPTECTLFSTYYNIETEYYDSSYIGRPLAGYNLYVVDKHMQLVPHGVPGELVVTGEGVGRGYLNRPDMNAEKFTTFRGEKAYRTGDLVRWSPDGNIDFMGRMDNQVKLRGLRIELGEIEARASQMEGIRTVCVDVKEVAGVQNLVCYYCDKEGMTVEVSDLKAWLSETLSDFMVPEIYMKLDTLPLTPNGKVNRRALPLPEMSVSEIVPPENETEQRLFDLAAEVLKHDKFGVTTNLISVGMTSLLAMRLVALMQQKYGWTLKMKEMLSAPAVREIAAKVGAADAAETYRRRIHGKQEAYPLTENQRGVYIDWEMNREALQYNIPAYRVVKNADADALRRALVTVVNAHPYLKTRLARLEGKVMQLRRDEDEPVITMTDLETEPDNAFFAARVRPFDLFNDTLYRLEIYRTSDSLYLFSDFHHIIFDGGSELVFNSELQRALRGEALETETYTAFDHALDEWAVSQTDAYADGEKYFAGLLSEFAVASYPHSSAPDSASPQSRSMELLIEGGEITRYCQRHGLTLNSFFMGVTTQVLHRLLREKNLLITSITNGREDSEMQQIVGMFVKTLPVVSHLSKAPVAEMFKEIQKQFIDTQDHSIVPYTALVDKYETYAEIMFAYQGGVLGDETDMPQMLSSSLDTVKMPISIDVMPKGDDYCFALEYDASLYSREAMEQFGRAVKCFAERCISEDCPTVDCVPLLTAEETRQMVEFSRGETMEYDAGDTFVSLFMTQARMRPEAMAVVDEEGGYSYSRLDQLTDALALHLRSLGVGDCTAASPFVSIMLGYQKEFLVAAIAVEKAGGAYVPLDYEYPNDRLLYMLEDSESRVLITSHAVYDEKCAGGDSFEANNILFIDDFLSEAQIPGESVNYAVPDGLAYMIYTSGSTGKPKGVMIPHRAKANFVHFIAKAWRLSERSRICCHSSFSFDASIEDLYPVLTVGGTLYTVPKDARKDMMLLHRFILDNGITGGCYTTQLGIMLLQQFPDLPVDYLVVGGEKMAANPPCSARLINTYGPTEFTVDATFFEVEKGRDYKNIPIGRPLYNLSAYVTDPCGQMLPQGMAGELCMAGPQIAAGYWKREELTAEKFAGCRFAEGKVYHTGDLVRYNEDGEIEYLGRIDNQVKLRGFRIELGEIETLISRYEGIQMQSVQVKEVGNIQHLCAYFSADRPIDEEALRTYLAAQLTDYMVPTVYMQLDAMPLTPNGKVDTKALPRPQLASQGAYVEPENDTERFFCGIFSSILNLDRVGATDSFFDLGGSSLAVMRIIVEADKAGYTLAYKEVFTHPTPRDLAQFVSGGETEPENKFSEITEYDYSTLEDVLKANTLDNFRHGERQELGNVLLTGATGFLGIHILKELIESEGGHIYCLVRGNKGLTPTGRLKTLLFYYFDSTFEEAFDGRITMVDGDITQPEIFTALQKEPIDTVINCAAVVKHFSQGTEIEDVNVGGVRNIISHCMNTDARLIHISTVSVGGMSVDGYPSLSTRINERMLYFGQSVDNQYIHSKFLAERYILEAVSRDGLNAKIMRVGNLAARDTDGEFQINFHTNSFMGRLKVFRMLGVCAYDELDGLVEFSPIDATARAILLLSTTPRECTVFHPYNSHTELMGDIFAEMKKLGMPVEASEPECFYAALEKAKADPAKAQTLSSLIAYVSSGNEVIPIDSENSYTLQVLHRMGYSWPYTSWDYISRFLLALKGLGFFE